MNLSLGGNSTVHRRGACLVSCTAYAAAYRMSVVVVTILFVFSYTGVASTVAGRFQFVHGTVEVTREERTYRAHRGDDIHEGDIITTAPASSAQVRMSDGALIAVRPRSELTIETYNYTGEDDGENSSVLNLARGGLRSVTGAIGRAQPDNVKIDTPVATMGIRGTDMDVFLVPPQSPAGPAAALPDSVLRVNTGVGVIIAAGLMLDVPAGFIAQASFGQPPQFIPALPPAAEAMEEESLLQPEEEGDEGESETSADGAADDAPLTSEDESGAVEGDADEAEGTNQPQTGESADGSGTTEVPGAAILLGESRNNFV